jgi:hypothetical protein
MRLDQIKCPAVTRILRLAKALSGLEEDVTAVDRPSR